jgi:hypothetical protein
MAERLPGLTDPNLPPDRQPLLDNSNPAPVAHPPQALHPDRFTPGTAPEAAFESKTNAKPLRQNKETTMPESERNRPAPKAVSKPDQEIKPRRNP